MSIEETCTIWVGRLVLTLLALAFFAWLSIWALDRVLKLFKGLHAIVEYLWHRRRFKIWLRKYPREQTLLRTCELASKCLHDLVAHKQIDKHEVKDHLRTIDGVIARVKEQSDGI